MRSKQLATAGFILLYLFFFEGSNAIAVVKPGEAYGSFQSKVSMCCQEGGGH